MTPQFTLAQPADPVSRGEFEQELGAVLHCSEEHDAKTGSLRSAKSKPREPGSTSRTPLFQSLYSGNCALLSGHSIRNCALLFGHSLVVHRTL